MSPRPDPGWRWHARYDPATAPVMPPPPPSPPSAPLPDNLRSYKVGVVSRGARLIAYVSAHALGNLTPAYCEHGVAATSGAEAKRVAIAEHKAKCMKEQAL